MASQKISQFNVSTSLSDSDLFTFVINGTNKNINYSNFKLDLGVTGSISQAGDPLGVPVLNSPTANTYEIRNLEAGAGIIPSVSAQNGISLKWNVAQDSVGFPITSNLTALQPVMTSLIAGTGIGIAQGNNSLTLSATGETSPTNTVIINQESDFPIQTATTITLSAKTRYVIGSAISSGKRFICEDGFVFTAENQFGVTYTYSGTGDMFSSTLAHGIVEDIELNAPNANQGFNMSDTSLTKIFICRNIRFIRVPKWGTYSGFATTIINSSSSIDSDDGLTLSGSSQTIFNISEFAIFSSSASCVQIDLGAQIIPNIEINNLVLIAPAGSIQLKGLPNNGNVPSGALAMISNSSVLGGSIDQLSGVSVDDFRWEFTGNNQTPDTRPDGLVSIVTNTTETVIAASSTDGSNAVKMAGTWTIEGSSHFTVDTTGRITYIGERNFTAPIDVTINVLMASGSTKNVAAYLNVNGTIERATEGRASPTSSNAGSVVCHWQHTFKTNEYIEVWLENQDDTVNVVGASGVLRVN